DYYCQVWDVSSKYLF
nr:immunoglobulin light chain junction region [Macaca mulatta]MOW57260.1 immunoglobulin light chain junction region [Macaca mulatta]MOW57415.1 immunoglobulin light chain junction region [Macaca mulatta]MOW57754.1 immunoglobulin light chain junction region [Macaca mulatta]MOW58094.1 immunoglobulin light chain junction region [Macaca mulatta]